MVIEGMEKRKIAMLTALYANTNFDGKENSDKREQIIQRMEEDFQKAVADLYKSKRQILEEAEEESLENDPFFKPMYKNMREKGYIPEKDGKYSYETDESDDDSEGEYEVDQI